jgi:hypothetical protein
MQPESGVRNQATIARQRIGALLADSDLLFNGQRDPSERLIASAKIRANTSTGPPAAYGTIMVIGRVGYACALAIRDTVGRAATPAARRRNCLR